MNYGGDAADQVVRYTLEGSEMVLKLSGAGAKNLALFLTALLKDQKKTRGKTRMVRMLKEGRPLRFYGVKKERMREFADAAKRRGLLFVAIKDRKNPKMREVMFFADDAAKMQRVLDAMGLDFVEDKATTAISEIHDPAKAQESAAPAKTETVETEQGAVTFEMGGLEDDFNIGQAEQAGGNFTQAGNGLDGAQTEKNLSGPSSPSSGSSPEATGSDARPSVRKELNDIRKEQKQKSAQQKAQPQKTAPAAAPRGPKPKTKGGR